MREQHENITIEDVIEKFRTYNDNKQDIDLIKRAYQYASEKHFGQKRITGDDYITHPLNVALILTDINADSICIAAALLHDTIEDSDSSKEEIEQLFGKDVALLVDGVTKINRLSFTTNDEAVAANQRKILVGLSEDVRVLIIKLADRLHNMRTLYVLSEEKQKRKAKETLEILTPIAHRLGINKIKSELEDLSLRYLNPSAYFDIVEKLNLKKNERDEAVSRMLNEVSDLLNEHNIKHEIKGRSKSIYSIYNKLNKGRRFDDIYDILALRVLVDTEQECYLALGLIHSKYKPVPKRFKDYIAMPKTNLYQSLHTTVFGLDGKFFEIQIRTYEMNEVAEIGIASHWSYKENSDGSKAKKDITEQKLQIFRSIIELNDEMTNSQEFVDSVKNELLTNDVIYVYTPKGDVIELPNGATPIDFAYKVHSEVGDTMIGAIVNDNIVPLNYELKNGDVIKINTNKNSKPSKDWLNFTITTQAKSKIKAYYSKLEKDDNLQKGMDIFEKELRKNNLNINDTLNSKNLDEVLEEEKIKNIEELYIGLATGKYNIQSIIKSLTKPYEKVNILDKINETKMKETPFKNEVLVENMSEIKATLSGCCKPIPNDNIIGYITRGSGISVHRSNCKNIIDIDERLVNVKWNPNINKKFITDIVVYTTTFDNLFDIIAKAKSDDVIIDSINTINKSEYKVYSMSILIENTTKLEKFMQDLLNLDFVNDVQRIVC